MTDTRLVEVPSREYVPIPTEATAAVVVEPYPAVIVNGTLDQRITILTAALAFANLKLRVIACLDGLEPDSPAARACLAQLSEP